MIIDLIKNNLTVSSEEEKKRKDICRKCDHYKILYCDKCGCSITLKTKLKMANCPIDMWSKTNAI